ncbi:ATP-binding cassette domain-containing protein [Halomarina halobia]|uniref:ATP-binding cassette domain-containing protein n=1 Tax=Halomarina halobia TaxID=3033386 RepID=A0ABD6AB60_9EURY|nr:ABC transporter ATP-binding protein [Halomarina sp. PSR21]
MTQAIRVRDLRKEYGDVRALDGLSLDVEEGEFFGLLGPNGAGKTTFINVLVGLARKTGGTAEVFGYDVESEYQRARDAVGLAPQEFNVDRFFPIIEVLEHKAGYHGIPPKEARRRAEEALKTVGIYDKRDTRFDWLSGGMKRRFVIARALVSDPDLLILDEPTAGVDVELRRDLWDLVRRLNDEGTTILLTTHYIEEAERLCDRVAIVDDGRRVEVATPDELRARSTDELEITLASVPTSLPEFDYEDVASVRVEGDTVRIRAVGAGRLAPDVLRDLDRADERVVDVSIRRASLEEVFVELTRQDDEEDREAETEAGAEVIA